MEGVEPPRLAALGSKPSVSTSSTTSPLEVALYILLLLIGKIKYGIKDYSLTDSFFSFAGNKDQAHIVT